MYDALMCAIRSRGHRIISVRPVKVISGAFPNYLYQNQFHVTRSGTGAGLIYTYFYRFPTKGIQMSFFYCVISLIKYYKYHRQKKCILLQIQMKLTTVKTPKVECGKTISNVFKLKQMIQKAANAQSIENKENIEINIQSATQRGNANNNKNIKFEHNMLKVCNFIPNKVERSKSEMSEKNQSKVHSGSNDKLLKIQLSNMNLNKLKINTVLVSSVKSNKSQKNADQTVLANKINKSHSSKTVSNKKIQGLSKSFRYFSSNSIKQELSIECFNLGRKLGKGRFGNVYAAQEKSSNLMLAIKIVNKKQLKQAQMQDQLLSEIKLQCYMRHPNILQMYGYFHDETNIYLMLELAEDCLFKELRRRTCYSEKQVAYYSKQIIQGLKYLHSQNIIHRDLKPQNIMLVNNVIKLADFGWSVYSPLYKRQTFCGTLDYVPPEIVKGDFYDERVDIWSLGILIYELTFGYAPFEGTENQQATFERIVNGDFEIPDHISQNLRNIIRFILISDPKKRLHLKDIEQSYWLKAHQMQGRSISQEIWNFWQQNKLN